MNNKEINRFVSFLFLISNEEKVVFDFQFEPKEMSALIHAYLMCNFGKEKTENLEDKIENLSDNLSVKAVSSRGYIIGKVEEFLTN